MLYVLAGSEIKYFQVVKDALGDSDEEGGSKKGEDKEKDGDAALPALSDSDDDAPKKDEGQVS